MVIVMANTGNVNTPEKHFVAFEVALYSRTTCIFKEFCG